MEIDDLKTILHARLNVKTLVKLYENVKLNFIEPISPKYLEVRMRLGHLPDMSC